MLGADRVRLPETDPFLGVKVPLAFAVDVNELLLAAAGFLSPPLMQACCCSTVALAEMLMSVFPRPTSRNETVRVVPDLLADALRKCGPAKAEFAAMKMDATANDIVLIRDEIFMVLPLRSNGWL